MVSGEKPADWGHLAPRHAIRHLSGESKWGKRARCWAPNRSIAGSGGSGAVLRGWPPVPKTPASRPRRAKDDPTWITYYELVGPNNRASSPTILAVSESQRLLQVRDYVTCVLQADGEADQVGLHTGGDGAFF